MKKVGPCDNWYQSQVGVMVDGDLGKRVDILEDLIGAPAHEAGTLAEQAELHSARIVEIHKLISDNQKDMVDRTTIVFNSC